MSGETIASPHVLLQLPDVVFRNPNAVLHRHCDVHVPFSESPGSQCSTGEATASSPQVWLHAFEAGAVGKNPDEHKHEELHPG